jgi:hypothetical protein
MWSDTCSNVFESKGDIIKSVNLDKRSFGGVTAPIRTSSSNLLPEKASKAENYLLWTR